MTIYEKRWSKHDHSIYLDGFGNYDAAHDPYYFDRLMVVDNFKLSGLGNFRIETYGEGTITKIPHFHMISSDNNIEFCIKLLIPEYFREEGDIIELNSVQKKELNELLLSKDTLYDSIWILMKKFWNGSYDCEIPNSIIPDKKNIQQPDYTQLH